MQILTQFYTIVLAVIVITAFLVSPVYPEMLLYLFISILVGLSFFFGLFPPEYTNKVVPLPWWGNYLVSMLLFLVALYISSEIYL